MSELQLKQWFVGGRIGYDDDENQDDEYYLPVHDGLDGFEIDRPFAIVYGPAMVWYSDSSGYFGDRNIYNVPKHTFEIYRQGENDKKTKIAYLNNDIKLRFEELSFENQPMYWNSRFLKLLERGIYNNDAEHTDFKITMNRFGHESGDAKKRKVPKVKPPIRVEREMMPLRQTNAPKEWNIRNGTIKFNLQGKPYERPILIFVDSRGDTIRIKSFRPMKSRDDGRLFFHQLVIDEQIYDPVNKMINILIRRGKKKYDIQIRAKLDIDFGEPPWFVDRDYNYQDKMDAFLAMNASNISNYSSL